MKRVPVIYMASRLVRAGPTRQLLNILSHMDRDRFSPSVVTLSPEYGDSMIDDFRRLEIPLVSLEGHGGAGIRAAMAYLRNAAKAGTTVVHTQGIRADVASALTRQPGLRRIATIRNYPPDDYRMTYGKVRGSVMAVVHLAALRRVDQVIAVSDTCRAQVGRKRVPADVILNGVQTKQFQPVSAEQKSKLRERFELPVGTTVLVATGHLSERKAPLVMIDAAEELARDRHVTLLLVGAGALEQACQNRVAYSAAKIRVCGRVADVRPYLQAADLFVSASRAEGLPNAALEAIASGLPVVLSDIGPHRELAELCDRHGALFPCGDPSAMATAVRQVLDAGAGPVPELVETAERRLSASANAARYQEVYEELVSR